RGPRAPAPTGGSWQRGAGGRPRRGGRAAAGDEHRRGAGGELAFELRELAPRGLLARVVADPAQPRAQRLVAELALEAALGREPRDVLAHALERLHLRVDREALQRGVQPAARLRVRERREHAALLLHERADLVPEAQQVRLRVLGLAAQRLLLALGALEVAEQRVLLRDQRDRELVLPAAHGTPHVVVQARDLGAPLRDLRL